MCIIVGNIKIDPQCQVVPDAGSQFFYGELFSDYFKFMAFFRDGRANRAATILTRLFTSRP